MQPRRQTGKGFRLSTGNGIRRKRKKGGSHRGLPPIFERQVRRRHTPRRGLPSGPSVHPVRALIPRIPWHRMRPSDGNPTRSAPCKYQASWLERPPDSGSSSLFPEKVAGQFCSSILGNFWNSSSLGPSCFPGKVQTSLFSEGILSGLTHLPIFPAGGHKGFNIFGLRIHGDVTTGG
jgi:hypothetical protein